VSAALWRIKEEINKKGTSVMEHWERLFSLWHSESKRLSVILKTW
jgi:hypothetical protein